jgi:hypothetical protein
MALNAECHYAECHYAECHYAECHYAQCHYAQCHYAQCHYAECHYSECHFAECCGALGNWVLQVLTKKGFYCYDLNGQQYICLGFLGVVTTSGTDPNESRSISI